MAQDWIGVESIFTFIDNGLGPGVRQWIKHYFLLILIGILFIAQAPISNHHTGTMWA